LSEHDSLDLQDGQDFKPATNDTIQPILKSCNRVQDKFAVKKAEHDSLDYKMDRILSQQAMTPSCPS